MSQNINNQITELLLQLNTSNSIQIQVTDTTYIAVDANNDDAVHFLQEKFSEKLFYLLLPEKIWLLEFLANPPIELYTWDGQPRITNTFDIVKISDRIKAESIYLVEVKDKLGYALLKRFRKPLLAVIA